MWVCFYSDVNSAISGKCCLEVGLVGLSAKDVRNRLFFMHSKHVETVQYVLYSSMFLILGGNVNGLMLECQPRMRNTQSIRLGFRKQRNYQKKQKNRKISLQKLWPWPGASVCWMSNCAIGGSIMSCIRVVKLQVAFQINFSASLSSNGQNHYISNNPTLRQHLMVRQDGHHFPVDLGSFLWQGHL